MPKISRINSSPVRKMRRWKHSRGNQCKETSTGTLKGLQVKEKPLVWLCSSGLKGEPESLITEAKDQALNMHYHHRNIIKQPTESKCRVCYKAVEYLKHIVVGYTALVPSAYTNRHNKVAGYMHWMVTPERVINVNSTTIMLDVLVIKYRTILSDEPAKPLHDKKEKTFLLFNTAIPDFQTFTQKKLKK